MIGTMREECRRCRGTADNINHFESIRHEGSRADDLFAEPAAPPAAPVSPSSRVAPDGSANYQHSGALSSERDLRRNLIARVVFSSSLSASFFGGSSLFRNVPFSSSLVPFIILIVKRKNNSDGNKTRPHSCLFFTSGNRKISFRLNSLVSC